jgi:hypothetical protein
MKALRRYVLNGDFESHMNQGFKWLEYFTVLVCIFAVIYFSNAIMEVTSAICKILLWG